MLMRIALLGGSAAGFAWAQIQPIRSGVFRLIMLLAIAMGVLAFLSLVWKRKWMRGVSMLMIFGVVAFLLLPIRPYDRDQGVARYKSALARYEQTPYVWGGETRNGIDCSGLPRAALRNALVQEGVRTLNGGLVRAAALHWWFDASARALADGYRDYMLPLSIEGRIRDLDYSELLPGDVAITESGVHCLVYFENNLWIQADPEKGKVAFSDGRVSGNAWLNAPVRVYRWRELQ